VVASPRNAETELVLATSRPYLDLSAEELERLFEESLSSAQRRGLPHRGVSNQSSWRQAFERLKKEVARQEVAASATAGLAASRAVDWAHATGLDLTDYNVPIAILVAMVVKAVWAEMNPEDGHRADHDEQQNR
jgi:hypothetical protein